MSYVPRLLLQHNGIFLTPTPQFDIDIYTEASSKAPVRDLVRRSITPQLRKKLHTLGQALMNEHGKDIQHAPGEDVTKNFTPAKVYSSSSVNKSTSSSSSTTKTTTVANGKGPSVNTTTVSSTEEFRTSAAELYLTLTTAPRIAAFTRAAPQLFSPAGADGSAQVGTKFEIFGGNVSGSYTELAAPTKIVQKWRLAQWPAGHFSELEIVFDQNDVDAVTLMRVEWRGVPVGQEETTRRNWGEYYVRSIKTTFGFGAIL